MAWIYHQTNNSLHKAFDTLINSCKINDKVLHEYFITNKYYRIMFRTDGDYDKIIMDDKVYSKARFLRCKNFKRVLIDYYKPLGVYVKGPIEIIKRDETITNRWIIELTPIYVQ